MTRNCEIKAYVPKTKLLFWKHQIGYGLYVKHFACVSDLNFAIEVCEATIVTGSLCAGSTSVDCG